MLHLLYVYSKFQGENNLRTKSAVLSMIVLQALPSSLLARILSHLAFPDLKAVCLVSKRLHTEASDPALWRHFLLDCKAVLHTYSPAVLLQVLGRSSNIR